MEAPPASLQFDASFESGNLAEARLVSEMPCAPPAFPHPLGTRPSLAPPLCPGGPPRHPPLHPLRRLEYDLHIRPDTLNTRHRVWFYFAVRGAARGQKVIFNLIGYSKTKSLYRDGMAPVVCTSSRPHWERMPESSVRLGLGLGLGLWLERQRGSVTQLITEWYTDGPSPLQVYYYKSPRHGKHYVLSFPFCFDRKDARKEEVYYFAYCFPYTYSYLQRFLHSLDNAQLQRRRMCYLATTPAAVRPHGCMCSWPPPRA